MTNTFTDPRDGEVYKIVEINNQIWMAENLRYKGPIKKFNDWIVEEKDFYFAPDGENKNIKNHGCLYTWNNAIKSCPEGWHLPSNVEFENLLRYSGSNRAARFKSLAAQSWGGDDSLGFRSLPSGHHSWDGSFVDFGFEAVFWSATEYLTISASACYLYFNYFNSYNIVVSAYNKKDAFSVRCIKD